MAEINAVFEEKWSTEVKREYNRTGSLLRKHIRVQTGVVGDTYNFPVFNKNTISNYQKARGAVLDWQLGNHDKVTATLTDALHPLVLDKLDLVKTAANYREQYVRNAGEDLGRQTDARILTALDAAAQVAPTTTGGLTFEKLLEAIEILNKNDVPMTDRTLVFGPEQLSDLLKETELTSGDYQIKMALANGQMVSAMGLNWVQHTGLTYTGSPASANTCYLVHKDAVGLAIAQDITTTIRELPERNSWGILSTMVMGSALIDPRGVVKITCNF